MRARQSMRRCIGVTPFYSEMKRRRRRLYYTIRNQVEFLSNLRQIIVHPVRGTTSFFRMTGSTMKNGMTPVKKLVRHKKLAFSFFRQVTV